MSEDSGLAKEVYELLSEEPAAPAATVEETPAMEESIAEPVAEAAEDAAEPVLEEAPFEEEPAVVEEPATEPVAEETPAVVEEHEPEPEPAPAPVAVPKRNAGLSFDNITNFEAHRARIVVVGVGGGGNNTVTALNAKGVNGAMTVAVNTDAKHLKITKANKKVLIGRNLTKGLGAGGYPDVGKNAAMESRGELRELFRDVDLVFVTCGLGGGTGTGAAPVVARLAKEAGAIVIAAVTLPFKLEGARMAKAEEGLVTLRQNCDTVIAIENQRLLELSKGLPLKAAFGIADGLIASMIKGITETIYEPSLVNLDYADVKAIMRFGGVSAIGVGEADDRDRASIAIQKAMNHPLLNVDYAGAKGALIHVTGGPDLKLEEVNKIGNYVQSQLDPDAQVIWGARILPEFENKIQVITIITGVKSPYIFGGLPKKQDAGEELGLEMVRPTKK